MNLAVLTPYFNPTDLTGAEEVNRLTAELLIKKGHKVTIITSNSHRVRYWHDLIKHCRIFPLHETHKKYTIIRLKHHVYLSSLLFVAYILFHNLVPKRLREFLDFNIRGPLVFEKDLKEILVKNKFDSIYAGPLPLRMIYSACQIINKCNLKTHIIVRPDFMHKNSEYHNAYISHIFNSCDTIHSVSEFEKNQIISSFAVDSSKIITIYNSLDVKALHSTESLNLKINQFVKKYNLQNKKIILFAGNKLIKKGVFTLLKAVNILYKKDKSLVLIMIGNGSRSWYSHRLFHNYPFLLDFDYVKGVQKEVIFALCDIFCMPSDPETFGMVYLEAWHKKKPIIGANTATFKEIFSKYSGGEFVSFNNERELAQKIKKLLLNKGLRIQYGENGYKALFEHYVSDKTIDRLVRLFRETV